MAGTITALELQKHDKERVSVFINEEYAFSLPLQPAAELKRGQYLTDEAIEALKVTGEREQAYERALRYLEFRPRSRDEVRRHLHRKGLPEAVVEETLERLQRARLIDDREFAQFWVENRQRFRPRGRVALRHELKTKGLSEDDISGALGDVNEEESAFDLARAQARRKSHLAPQEMKRHLGQYLARRGFQYSVIGEVVRRVEAELGLADDEDTSSGK